MKKMVLLLFATWLLVPMTGFSQTYQTLWKQVEEAQDKDLPATALTLLEKIETKATKELAYGQLLKATLLHARLQAEVAPDSLRPAVDRLERQERAAKDVALKAVYCTVLSKIYEGNRQLGDDWEVRRNGYCQQALAHPEALAEVKAGDFTPFVINGADSELYGDDLLSVVGTELKAWQWMHAWYEQTGNRRAACLTALEQLKTTNNRQKEKLAQSAYIRSLDSLTAVYGDLQEACEVAIERYSYMSSFTDATAAEKFQWLEQSLSRWGKWKRANELRNEQQALTSTNFEAVIEQKVTTVNRQQMVKLRQLRHIENLTMRIYQTKLTGDTSLNPENEKDYQTMKSDMKELKERSRTLTFSGHADYEVFEDSVLLEGLPAGIYMVEFSTRPQTRVSRGLYFVSDIRTLMEAQPDNKMRYVVVDAVSGQPVSGATVRLTFSGGWNQPEVTKTLTCDQQGEVVDQSERQPSHVLAYTATDRFSPSLNGYGRYSYYERPYNTEHTSLFTDRSVYRPGQTVHVTAIVWKEVSALENQAVADKSVKMELHDANYKLVAEQLVTTDRFGKCATSFTLPTGLLNGRFTLRANNGSCSIRVEEYKRPTFQIEFPEYKEPYKQGDTVRVQGKAQSYAGVPVQSAKVRYSVRRQVAFWWMTVAHFWQTGFSGRMVPGETVQEGETVTAEDGTFTVEMPLTLPTDMGYRPMFYHFVAEVDVTDVAGETHRGTMTLPLGNKPTVLTCDVPQQVRADQLPKVTFGRWNAAGQEITGKVSYVLDNGTWRTCEANVACAVFGATLKSGEHRLKAVCEQDTTEVKFVVFGLGDKKPAITTDDWYYVSHDQFPSDGKPVTLQVGSSDPNLHIVYGIYADNKLIESGAVKKNAALENRQFTYQEKYGNGLLLTYAWVKDGKSHIHHSFIRRPMPDKKLKMTWETFRNRLTPGQQEEWSLKIQQPDGTTADASLMAVLYDKSLDAIYPHQWSFAPANVLSIPTTGWQWASWGALVGSGAADYNVLDVPTFDFSRFDEDVYPYNRRSMMIGAARPMMMVKNVGSSVMMAEKKVASVESGAVAKQLSRAAAAESPEQDAAAENSGQETSLRENLNETAFCYPAVEADENGRYVLKFTLPESLTTWRFMGVSHTVDMLYGSIEGEAVAKKDVMVQPNMPRFVRVGDESRLTVRIFNMSEKAVSGQATMTLTLPEDGKVVQTRSVPFQVEAGKTTTAVFPLGDGKTDWSLYSLLVCKVVASGEGFSDGEQHYLPILPDQEYVTRTVSYVQNGPGEKTINLAKLFPAGTSQHKLTVEYTNNPAWLMVQSLPVIGQPWEQSAIEQAASYYSNSLAKNLLAQNPQAKTAFELWKRETGDETTLMSSLQKNQELKDLVLTETPWVAAADLEAEQKQRLADFFDENAINNRLKTTVEKLKKLQNSDGSFSWYPGMKGSTMVTITVQEMLTRLKVMTDVQEDTRQMQANAFAYLGKEVTELVAEMKEQQKKGRKPSFPSLTALRWLYICAIDGRTLSSEVRSANDYLIALLKKDIKNQSIYEKALTTIVLAKRGDKKKADEYVRSLKEYSVFTEEMGRYYDTPRAGYSWFNYKIPTEVAALEAIQTVNSKDAAIDEMRRWLLQEKRTQAWDTPINSVNAIYAFLNGSSSLNASGAQTTLAIDGETLKTPHATAAMGYVKTAVNEPEGRTFTASKTSEGTSWGALYAQFMQKTYEVEESESGLSIRREIVPTASVGDRIVVRIIIEASRDLDFVQVVDRRAACMEPVRQLSGYQNGAYVSPKDCSTNYYYYSMPKGRHEIVTEYYIDRAGCYETGTCTVGCAYAPEFRAIAPSVSINVK